jgi:O-antigen ligase
MQELDAGEESAHGRVEAWYEGMHMFFDHPLFGVGRGNFTEYNDLTAHNSFVLVLAEAGFVGFMLWLAFVGYSFWMMRVILRHQPDPTSTAEQAAECQDDRAMAMTLWLALWGLFAAAFFLSRSYMIVLYLVLAMVTGYYVGARQRLPSLPAFTLADGWWRWVPTAMGSVVGMYVLVAVLMRTS